ncbi:MAG TPA: signal peptidase I, partial [Leucothrix sp.]|nr:signal peptidase I [Leucothrix sp.]
MESSLDLELILVSLASLAGLIIIIYWFMQRGKKKTPRDQQPMVVDYAKSFFPVLLIVVLLRS